MSGPDLEEQLRGSGLRVTRQRLAVLTVLHDHPHTDTDTVIRRVREVAGDVSHQAVYDVLRALTEAGLVRRIQPTGSVARYEVRGRRQPPPRRMPFVCRDRRRRLRRRRGARA